jgi:hypothetical protein
LPIGATLTIGGVFLCALLQWRSDYETQDWVFSFLSDAFFLSLVAGTVLWIAGSFLGNKFLTATQAKKRRLFRWIASGSSLILLLTTGNVHGWTFTFAFPAFAGFAAGVVVTP